MMPDKDAGPMGLGFTHTSVVTDRAAVLKRLQARLCEEIDMGPQAKDLPVLVGRLQSVMAELDQLGVDRPDGAADQIAARRAARRRAAT